MDGVCPVGTVLASEIKKISFVMLIHWGVDLLICVEDMLRHQRRSTIIESLDIGDFLFADPDRIAGCGVFGN